MADSNRTLIEQFYAKFNESRSDLSTRLEAFKNDAAKPKDVLDQIALDIAQLRKDLADATSYLPAYDQRQYELQVKNFEQSLDQLRTASAPKPKFAFKRKQAAPSSGQTTPSTKPPLTSPNAASSTSTTISNNARSLSGHSGAYLGPTSLPASSSASGSELTISDVDNCIINLFPTSSEGADVISALHVKNVKRSVLLLPVMSGSAILHDVQDTVLVIGCHQFRMHTSSHVDVYLSIPSNPIIEHCSNIRFAKYPTHLTTSPSNDNANKYLSVQDFSHIRATPSPNWQELPGDTVIGEERWPVAPGVDDVRTVLQSLLPKH
ncbi:hypothetical protein EIP91_005197 [Steccherinum ochraceum]|uniref:C-CAP/cofactor C-like domain-containing protein n=1 Tax=Steccherinum ochraceum TaxID=92696 RepID=A0A4R0RFV4_9APHY|nr:hypothetical protein EIP91_005197 [Steccherinum ochraceum]